MSTKSSQWTNGMIAASSDTCAHTADRTYSKEYQLKCWDLLFRANVLITTPPTEVLGLVYWLYMPLFYGTKIVLPFYETINL